VRDLPQHTCKKENQGRANFSTFNAHAFEEIGSAHRNILKVYRLVPTQDIFQISELCEKYMSDFKSLLASCLNRFKNIKVQARLNVTLKNLERDDEVTVYLNSFSHISLHETGISELLFSTASQLIHILNNYSELESMWGLVGINSYFFTSFYSK